MTTTVLLALLKKLEGKVDSLELIRFEPVTELPETGEPNVIYLVPKSDPETGNYSDEYIWDSDNQTYEKIGDTLVGGKEILECTKSGNNLVLPTGIRCMDLRNDLDAGKDIVLHFDNQYWYYIDNYIFWNIKPGKASSNGQFYATIHFLTVPLSTSDTIIPAANDTSTFNIMNLPMPWMTGNAGKYLRVSTGAGQTYELVDPIPNANPNIAPAYNATATYDLGDLVIYNNNLYECTTAITVAEAWTAAHWTQKTVSDQLSLLSKDTIIIQAALTSFSNGTLTLPTNMTFQFIKDLIDNGKIVIIKALIDGNINNPAYFYPGYKYTVYHIRVTYSSNMKYATLYNIDYSSRFSYNTATSKQLDLMPSISTSDAGKFIAVSNQGVLYATKLPTELPTVTSSDEGKVAMVDSNGNWVAGNIPDGSNTSY